MKKTKQKPHILLVNLGSPDAPDTSAVRRYLKQFLSDKRVVDFSRWLWLPILHGIILNIRPKKVAKSYLKIWGNGKLSPLVQTCQKIADKLDCTDYSVDLSMRYGNPSIKATLDKLHQSAEVENLIILPMFPQYSSATTASVFDAIHQYYANKRTIPSIKFFNNYHDNSFYIKALAQKIISHQKTHSKPNKLIIAFHGIPQRFIDTGDIYQKHCQNTAQLLAKELGLNETKWLLVFQSQFGREPWLQPYLSQVLTTLPAQGFKNIQIISPGFSADCLETLEELAIASKAIFLKSGGEKFTYINALNDDESHIKMWQDLINSQITPV